jgi:hypothetical protein
MVNYLKLLLHTSSTHILLRTYQPLPCYNTRDFVATCLATAHTRRPLSSFCIQCRRWCMTGTVGNGINLVAKRRNYLPRCKSVTVVRICREYFKRINKTASCFRIDTRQSPVNMDFQTSLYLQTSLLHQLCPLVISFVSIVICKYGRREIHG